MVSITQYPYVVLISKSYYIQINAIYGLLKKPCRIPLSKDARQNWNKKHHIITYHFIAIPALKKHLTKYLKNKTLFHHSLQRLSIWSVYRQSHGYIGIVGMAATLYLLVCSIDPFTHSAYEEPFETIITMFTACHS